MSRRRRERGAARAAAPRETARPDGGQLPVLLQLLPVLAGLVALTVFLPALKGGILNWDDPQYLFNNYPLQRADGGALLAYAFHSHSAVWHPLSWLAHAGMWRLYGNEVRMHHALPWLLHGLNAGLFTAIALRILTRGSALQARWTAAGYGALFAAGVFALHPLRVESVAWIAETKDMLCAAFSLGAWFTYLHFREPRSRHPRLAWLSFFTLSSLALLSKAQAVTLPIALILCELYLSRDESVPEVLRRRIAALLPVIAAASIVVIITISAGAEHLVAAQSLSLASRLLLAASGIGRYLRDFLAPLWLSPLVPRAAGAVWNAGSAALAALALVATGIALRRPRHGLSLAYFAFLLMILPVSGLFQIGPQAGADRFTHLSQAGFALAAGWGLRQLIEAGQGPFRRMTILALACWLAALTVMTRIHIPVYADSEALWTNTLRLYPEAGVAWANLGSAREARGDLTGAVAAMSRAAAASPDDPGVLGHCAAVLVKAGRLDDAAARVDSALALAPGATLPHLVRGQIYLAQGRGAEAIPEFDIGLSGDPDLPAGLAGRGRARAESGDLSGAEADFSRALWLAPDDLSVRTDYATLLASSGREADARREFEAILARAPDNVEALVNRGILRASSGDLAGARADFERGCVLDPRSVPAYLNALHLALLEKRTEDIRRLAARLREIAPGNPEVRALLDAVDSRR